MIYTDSKCPSCRMKFHPECERCRMAWLINKAAECRRAQATYFRTRKASDLQTARRHEATLDAGLEKAKKRNQQVSFDFGANVDG